MGLTLDKHDNNPYLQPPVSQSPDGIENKSTALKNTQQNKTQALVIKAKSQENSSSPLEGARVNSNVPKSIVRQSRHIWGRQDKSVNAEQVKQELAEESLEKLISKNTNPLEFSRSIKKAVLKFIDNLKTSITNKGKDILAVFFSQSSHNATQLFNNSSLIKKTARGKNEDPIPFNSPEAKELQAVFGKDSFILNEIDSPLYIEPSNPDDPEDNVAAKNQALLSNIKGFYTISPPPAKTKEEREEKILLDLVIINNICQMPKGLEAIKKLVNGIKEQNITKRDQALADLKQFPIPVGFEDVCKNAFREIGKLNKKPINNTINEQVNINQLNEFLALNVLEEIMPNGVSPQSSWKNMDWSFQVPLIIEDLKKELFDYPEISKLLINAINLDTTDENFKKELAGVKAEVDNYLKEYKLDSNTPITIFARGLMNYLVS